MPAYLYRINRWIEHFLNAKGAPTIVDVVPSLQVEAVFQTGVEDRIFQGFNRFMVQTTTTANAGTSSGFQIRNPIASNVVVVIERWFVKLNHGISTNSNIIFSRDNSGPSDLPGSTARGVNLDARNGGQLSTAVTSANNNVANLGNFVFTADVSGGPGQGFDLVNTINQEIAIAPGDAWRVTDSTVNEIMMISMTWRERALETSELIN